MISLRSAAAQNSRKAASASRWICRLVKIGSTPADRELQEKLGHLAASLRAQLEAAEALLGRVGSLPSYQEGQRIAASGLSDPPTLGFNLFSGLEIARDALDVIVPVLEQVARQTVADLVADPG